MEIVIVVVIVGILVLAAWPLLARRSAGETRTPEDQGEVTDTSVTPPAHPDEPIPGSRTYREQQGRP